MAKELIYEVLEFLLAWIQKKRKGKTKIGFQGEEWEGGGMVGGLSDQIVL